MFGLGRGLNILTSTLDEGHLSGLVNRVPKNPATILPMIMTCFSIFVVIIRYISLSYVRRNPSGRIMNHHESSFSLLAADFHVSVLRNFHKNLKCPADPSKLQ